MHDHRSHSTRSRRRAGVSLIELTVVMILVAIGAAVVAPKWTQALDRTRVMTMRQQVEADFAALRRAAVRRGKQINFTVSTGTGSFTFSPAMPELLGDASGLVNYSSRYPGVVFSAANFNSGATAAINIYGELVSASTGARLTNALLTMTGPSSATTIDLLTQEGLVSVAAPP